MTEDEAAFLLQEIIHQEQQRIHRLLIPFMEELAKIGARKTLLPVELPDGTVAIYKGPTAVDVAGSYFPPQWLERIAIKDDNLRRTLSHYREVSSERRGPLP